MKSEVVIRTRNKGGDCRGYVLFNNRTSRR